MKHSVVKKFPFIIGATVLSVLTGTSFAIPITSDIPVTTSVSGSTSIYQIFGHSGNTGGDYGAATNATLLTFASGVDNVFTFTASGTTNCCSGSPSTVVDGGSGTTNVIGVNGLSNAKGNTILPLLGLFTTDTDPFGSTATSSLVWNAYNPTSLSPLLGQVFYIGDGLSGYMNSAGSSLEFTAPVSATRLYLGVADAWAFNGLTGYYKDNTGSYTVATTLHNATQVPEPMSLSLMVLGLVGIGVVRQKKADRKSNRSTPSIAS